MPQLAGKEPRTVVPAQRRRIGELLLREGWISEAELDDALVTQADSPNRARLGQIVVEKGYLTEEQLAEGLALLLGLDLVDLAQCEIDASVSRLVPRHVAERGKLLALGHVDDHGDPVREGGVARAVLVAAADPTNVVALDDVRIYTGAASLAVVVAAEGQIREYLARIWAADDQAGLLGGAAERDHDGADGDSDLALAADQIVAADQAPTVRLATGILDEAVRSGASDIHVEPQADGVRVRYRVDGLLRDALRVPRSASAALISRLKIVSGLDIAERRVPQDGRTRFSVAGTSIDARVSTLPSMYGEKVVVRLLGSATGVKDLEGLGLDAHQLETLVAGAQAPQGLVLITGPTGSGKTNTLYSLLAEIATPDKNVVTLEDPVEIQLPGITQVQTNERTGLTFARGLRSVLRQDPDVVLVGEVRDSETAELALQASLTGHLVLTTLHTNDAVSALTRLVDMGVEPFLVASSLTMVVAQRLLRRPCARCAKPDTPDAQVMALLGIDDTDLTDARSVRGTGCYACDGSGYRGRVGIFEILPVTAALRSVLMHSPTEAAVRAAARASSMTTLRAAGLAAARRGETTFDEVVRATRVDAVDGRRCVACDRQVAHDMIACPWCATVVNRGHCRACAKPLEPDWKICPWCQEPAGTPTSGADARRRARNRGRTRGGVSLPTA